MKKPHIRKIKGSPYWSCEGCCAVTPKTAYCMWKLYWWERGFVA